MCRQPCQGMPAGRPGAISHDITDTAHGRDIGRIMAELLSELGFVEELHGENYFLGAP